MKKAFALILVMMTLQVSAKIKLDKFSLQKIRFGAITGYAFFNQKELKKVNDLTVDTMPFEVKNIDQFDPSFYWGGYIQYQLWEKIYLGPTYEYHYSGSRMGAKDYSALYIFDQSLHSHQIGLKFDNMVVKLKQSWLSIELNAGINLTHWEVVNKLEQDKNTYYMGPLDDVNGSSIFVSPALKYDYKLSEKLTLVSMLTYAMDFMHSFSIDDNKLEDTPTWNGVKFAIGVEF
ncbi:hypothetical protein EYV94_12905 [Puteibacter caeruleilacunae]|nr:hypothetical protein EYV94_12905 [Puteibacter caeruleilacunae]